MSPNRKRPAAAARPRTLCEALEVRVLCDATSYLESRLDMFHQGYQVYSDFAAAGNHFLALARMNSPGGEANVPVMNERCTTSPRSGSTDIEAIFKPSANNWGGWYLQNGVLQGSATAPSLNFGTVPNAGVNLTGATQLSFWARGSAGDEKVEFIALGVGRDENGDPEKPYPDSSVKVSTGVVTLTTQWKLYTISLAGANLSYVLGGFGWAASGLYNARNIRFYIDDIQYNLPRPAEPRLALSYKTAFNATAFDSVATSAAYTYDNAVSAMALIAAGQQSKAKLIIDSFLYAQDHDPYYTDGRLRNAYQAGDLVLPPGWTPNGKVGAVRKASFYSASQGKFVEDGSFR